MGKNGQLNYNYHAFPAVSATADGSPIGRSDSFVFSWRLDILAFYIPLLLGICVSQFSVGPTFQSTIVFMAIVVWFSDQGHVFATAVPVALDKSVRSRFGKKIWLLPLLVLPIWFALSQVVHSIFIALFGYFALYHIIMQQYGWMKMILRKVPHKSAWESYLDLAVFWNVYLIPVLYWHTGLSQVTKSYYVSNDLALTLSPEVWKFALPLHWAINILFLGKVIVDLIFTDKAVLGKLLFIIYSWIWFYRGLVVFDGGLFFWTVLALTHGIAYHIFVNTYWRRTNREAMASWFVKDGWIKFAGYILAITLISRIWIEFKPAIDAISLMPIHWSMTMSHHAFDSILWRKRLENKL